jgi:MFS family permease
MSASPPTAQHRRRAYGALFGGVAASTTGFIAVASVYSLVAEDLTGTAAWSGVPAAAAVLGTAAGTTALANVVRRIGPWKAMTAGYGLAALAMGGAAYAIVAHSFLLFMAALFVFGVGYGSNRLARYVAADLYPPSERATMIGWIVWASTFGAVAGPGLIAPVGALAVHLSMDELVGPFLLCLVAVAVSAVITWFGAAAGSDAGRIADQPSSPASDEGLWRQPRVLLALVSMVSGQFVMVLVMTMTPVHLRHDGHGLGAIGLVIAAHTLGMFALSPLTGAVADRVGRVRVLAGAVVVLVGACLVGVAAAWMTSYPMTLLSLFLLGIGWNGGFVAGSALLTDSVPAHARTRIQGRGDTIIWTGGALASLASGWLLARTGFAGLGMIGAVLALAPVWPLWRLRSSASAQR